VVLPRVVKRKPLLLLPNKLRPRRRRSLRKMMIWIFSEMILKKML
jgi:hypothetical protein